jgi:hypothetical protein
VIGTDPVSKGTFNIVSAHMIYDYDDDDELDTESRAKGEIRIAGQSNPLYKIGKANPLRLQGLIGSVLFGDGEKRFIKFISTKHYILHEDGIYDEIELDVVFDILDNLEYVENVIEYKDNNLL